MRVMHLLAVLAILSAPAIADPWKEGHGHRRSEYRDDYRGEGGPNAYDRGRKEKFWEGNCKVEREWKRSGEYKEKRKCKDRWD